MGWVSMWAEGKWGAETQKTQPSGWVFGKVTHERDPDYPAGNGVSGRRARDVMPEAIRAVSA